MLYFLIYKITRYNVGNCIVFLRCESFSKLISAKICDIRTYGHTDIPSYRGASLLKKVFEDPKWQASPFFLFISIITPPFLMCATSLTSFTKLRLSVCPLHPNFSCWYPPPLFDVSECLYVCPYVRLCVLYFTNPHLSCRYHPPLFFKIRVMTDIRT